MNKDDLLMAFDLLMVIQAVEKKWDVLINVHSVKNGVVELRTVIKNKKYYAHIKLDDSRFNYQRVAELLESFKPLEK